MQVESHIPIHRQEIAQRGYAIINGLRFTRGPNGTPTATDVHEDKLHTFNGVPGYVFRHDDGAYAGESKARRAPTGPSAQDHLSAALADGNVSPELLIALGAAVPVIGQDAQAPAEATEEPAEATEEPERQEDEFIALKALTVPKLKALCRDRGLTFGPGADKAALIALLTGAPQ